MLFFGIGFALGVLFGTFIRKQGIKERDEEIKRLKNLIDDLEYYLSKDKKVSSKKIGLGIFMFLNIILIVWLMLTL